MIKFEFYNRFKKAFRIITSTNNYDKAAKAIIEMYSRETLDNIVSVFNYSATQEILEFVLLVGKQERLGEDYDKYGVNFTKLINAIESELKIMSKN